MRSLLLLLHFENVMISDIKYNAACFTIHSGKDGRDMNCPYCGYFDSKVIDSRPSEEKIRRRRECLSCAKRFTSYEVIERLPLMVIKKDDKREPFDREKLLRGLLRATKKRPIKIEALEKLIDDIEIHYANQLLREVTSDDIGENVLQRLKEIDLVAYVRFASVYRDFADVETFVKVISELSDEVNHSEEQQEAN